MSASTSSTAPNTALYVKNIPSKIKKQELRRQLFCLFVTYGKVLDVVATRAAGMRGQAFVVFEDLASSTAALRALDGFTFYGQPLTLDYAKNTSKATIVAEKGPEALFDPAIAALSKKTSGKVTFSSAGAELQGRERKRAREEAGQRGDVPIAADSDESSDDEGDADKPPDVKRRKSEASMNGGTEAEKEGDEDEMQLADSDESDDDDDRAKEAKVAPVEMGAPLPAVGDQPNNLLFCGDLPDEATDEMLGVLFQQYPGFRTVQLLPPKQERNPSSAFAFVEFASVKQASTAIEGLNGFKLAPGKLLNVAYAARRPAA